MSRGQWHWPAGVTGFKEMFTRDGRCFRANKLPQEVWELLVQSTNPRKKV